MTENPTARVRKKAGRKMAQIHGPGQLPQFSVPNAGDVEKNQLHGFAEIDSEIAYLKRLALRAELSKNPAYSKFVPDLNEREVLVASYLEQLNKLSRDPAKRLVLENVFTKFNSTNVFNIAQEMAELRLNKNSVDQMEALISGGVDAMVEKATGLNSDAAQRARDRAGFAAAGARA